MTNNDGPLNLLRNEGGNRRSWVMLKLTGAARPGKKGTSRDGVGAFVTVTSAVSVPSILKLKTASSLSR